jgi:hypothetical protein
MGRPIQFFSYNSPPLPSTLSKHVKKSSLSQFPLICPLNYHEKNRKILFTISHAFLWYFFRVFSLLLTINRLQLSNENFYSPFSK